MEKLWVMMQSTIITFIDGWWVEDGGWWLTIFITNWTFLFLFLAAVVGVHCLASS